jgi:hypothetical protein
MFLTAFLFTACPITWESPYSGETYSVYYYGNNHTGGELPMDTKTYRKGNTVTIREPGNLVREGYEFIGWRWNIWDAWYTLYQPNETVTVDSGDIMFYAVWRFTGELFEYSLKGDNVTIIRYTGPALESTLLEIPDKIQDKSVVHIGDEAFMNTEALSIVLPKDLETIGVNSFSHNYLTSVDIPDKVKTIGAFAFLENMLYQANLGEELEIIGAYAFAANQMTHLNIPNSVTIIEPGAFYQNAVDFIHIGSNVEIKSGSALGIYGTSFREYYESQNRQAGLYTYVLATKTWTLKQSENPIP